MAAYEIFVPSVNCVGGIEFLMGSIDIDEHVTTSNGGTFLGNMSAQKCDTSVKKVTAEECGMVQDNKVTATSGSTGIKMTAQKDKTLVKNAIAEGCGMADKIKITMKCGRTLVLG